MHGLKRYIRYWKHAGVHRLRKGKIGISAGPFAPFKTTRIESFDEYGNYVRSMAGEYESRELTEQALRTGQEHFVVPGYCFVCGQAVSFLADYDYGFKNEDGQRIPNWRECLICPGCRLNNRMRAAIHLFQELCRPWPDCSLYITEQTTPMFKWLKGAYANVIGSEFLGPEYISKSKNTRGIRNEDLTGLSFRDEAFDFVLSFDVFEHIPNYRKAFSECRRVLKKGGVLFFTIPFDLHSARNIIRAEILPDGTTNHLMPPEYHGDPLRESGCLCFRHFGWECLDELKNEGFSEAACYLYWSREYGYLGGEQLLFLSRA
ncbi:MAG: class I SAM-dependent methyltransferase [Deltaproteobacteria bacterium]|nr:class I SAM-dependent methyltransferase [Deltaproteobacteria bacterium]